MNKISDKKLRTMLIKTSFGIVLALVFAIGGNCLLSDKQLSNFIPTAHADTTYFNLTSGNLSQDWTNTGLITTNNDWSGVPSITGYSADTSVAVGTDPQTVVADITTVNVIANSVATNPNVGGVYESELANPTISFNGAGSADNPNIVIYLNSTGRQDVTVNYTVRDLDSSADDAVQQVALQYRIGTTGNFTNVPAGFIMDATTASSAIQTTTRSVVLPDATDNQAQLQVRILTTNAAGSDELIGIDDILVTSVVGPAAVGATASGRVTLPNGRGIFRAVVTMTDSQGNVQTAYTNQQGYFNFTDVAGGETYIFTATHRRYQFAVSSQVQFIAEDNPGINFTATDGNGFFSPIFP